MDELEYRGNWWLADEDEEKQVAGVLEFDPDDGGTLELIGSFDNFGNNRSREVDLINGVTTDGKLVTLQDCFVNQSGISSTMQTQSCNVRNVFTDVLFSGGDLELEKVCVSFPLLEMWTTSNIVHRPEGQLTGAEISKFDEVEAELDEATIRLNITPTQNMEEWYGIEITQQAY